MSSSEYFTNPYANMLNTFKEENQSKINVSVNLDQKLDFLLKGLSYTQGKRIINQCKESSALT